VPLKVSTTDAAVKRAEEFARIAPGVYEVLGWVELMGVSGALLRGYNGILVMQTGRDLLTLDQTEAHARLAQSMRAKGPRVVSEAESQARRERMEAARKERWKK
jgi:hypothetical protein